MYRKIGNAEEFPEIALYFEGRLNPENRWVKMAARLPWEELEADYARHFKSHGRGEIALNVRIAIGALLVKEFLGLSDRGVVEAVSENVSAILSRFQKLSDETAVQCFLDDAFSQTISCGSHQPF
jgi:hypothetical protein